VGVKESKKEEEKKGGLLLFEVEDNWDLIGREVSGAKNRYSKNLREGKSMTIHKFRGQRESGHPNTKANLS